MMDSSSTKREVEGEPLEGGICDIGLLGELEKRVGDDDLEVGADWAMGMRVTDELETED